MNRDNQTLLDLVLGAILFWGVCWMIMMALSFINRVDKVM